MPQGLNRGDGEVTLVERLRALANQQADGTDFHNGRVLTAEDTMYAVAADTIEALVEALTPSADTKAAYIGEFSFTIDEQSDDAMCEVSRKVDVPWTTIKEIMAAIRARAKDSSK